MSILIKNMEMPKNCNECPFCDYEQAHCLAKGDKRTDETRYEARMKWCPLIELLPHGRLIDADALKKTIQEEADFLEANCGEEEHSFKVGSLSAYGRAIGCIREMPTIIESEGEDGNS